MRERKIEGKARGRTEQGENRDRDGSRMQDRDLGSKEKGSKEAGRQLPLI